MNWEAIGAVAEFVSALAVLVTLVYLAVQVRQNSRSQDRQNEIAIGELYLQRAAMVADSYIAMCDPATIKRVTGKFFSNIELEDPEFEDFYFYMNATLTMHECHHQLYLLGLFPEEQWQQTADVLTTIVRYPGFQTLWERDAKRYRASFRSILDANLSSANV